MKYTKPNILSRALRLLFAMTVIVLVVAGSNINVSFSFNADKVKKPFIDHLGTAIKVVKQVKDVIN